MYSLLEVFVDVARQQAGAPVSSAVRQIKSQDSCRLAMNNLESPYPEVSSTNNVFCFQGY